MSIEIYSNDPSGGAFPLGLNISLLYKEISENVTLTSKFLYIITQGTDVLIHFSSPLTTGGGSEEAELDAIVAAHDPSAAVVEAETTRVDEQMTTYDVSQEPGGILNISNQTTKFIKLTASLGANTIKLPDATTLAEGWVIFIVVTSDSTASANIYNNADGLLDQIDPDREEQFLLINNTTVAGEWIPIHAIYPSLSGRSGGQTLIGGTDASDDLVLNSTSNATKGQVIISENTESTDILTGAFVVSGGVGIVKNVNIGGDLLVQGVLTIDVSGSISGIQHSQLDGLGVDDHTQYAKLTGRTSGQIITGGTNASENLTLRSSLNATKGYILIDETTPSTTTTTGAIVISGGLGLAGNINVGGDITGVNSIITGEVSFGSDASANPILTITNADDTVRINSDIGSTDSTTGSLVVTGGIGVSENIHSLRNIESSTTVNISTSYQLTANSEFHIFAVATTSNDVIVLPNATTLPLGWKIHIIRDTTSTVPLQIQKFGQPVFYLLGTDKDDVFELKNNSTAAGEWIHADTNCVCVIHVNKYGPISTIKDAVDGITDASPTQRYIVKVGAGIFTEDPFTLKQYVDIIGASESNTILTASDLTNPFITMSLNTTLYNLTIKGASGVGGVGVYIDGIHGAVIDSCRIEDCETLVYCVATSSAVSHTYIRNSELGIHGTYSYGIHLDGRAIVSTENIVVAVINSQIGVSSIVDPSNTPIGVFCDGPKSLLNITSCHCSGAVDAFNGINYQIQDGAIFKLSGGVSSNWDTCVYVPIIGDPPNIEINSLSIYNCTQDVNVAYSTTTGSLSGHMDRTKVIIESTTMAVSILDSVNPSSIISGALYLGNTFNEIADFSDLLQRDPTMGVQSGGSLTAGTGTAINVSSGYGYAMKTANSHDRVSWSTTSNFAIGANVTRYIYVTNTGVITAGASLPSIYFAILLGRVRTNDTTVEFIEQSRVDAHHVTNQIDRFNKDVVGAIFSIGGIITFDVSGSRTINVSNGTYYYSITRYVFTGGSPITFGHYYHDGSGNFIVDFGQTNADNTSYDSGTGLVALTASYYTKHALYLVGSGANEKYMLVHGTINVALLQDAIDGTNPLVPTYFTEGVVLLGYIIVQEGNDDIVDTIDGRPFIGSTAVTSGGGGGVTDHGALTGLNDDDHLQYLLTSGTRSMDGNLNMNNNSIVMGTGLVDGVDVSLHGSRHNPAGADPITTGNPSTLDTTSNNTGGVQNSVSRSDHLHKIDITTSNGLATITTAQTLTNKTLTSPIISQIVNTGTLTLPTSTDTIVGRATTDTLTNKTLTSPIISQIVNTGTLTLPTSTDTLVGRATTDTLTNKTLTSPIISTIVNTGTLTLPTSTDTIVGRATTDTLTNKTLNASSTSIIDGADNTKIIQFILSGLTTATTRTMTFPNANTTIVGTDVAQTLTNKTLTSPIISTIVNTGTLTLPTSTDTLIGRATTDTLTNKTLNASSTSIIDGVDNTKIIQFILSGITTGTTRTMTFPNANTTIVGTDVAQTLTNKTLTTPIISSISNTGTLTLPTSTDTLVGRATTDTLTNKTLTSPIISQIVNTGTLTLPTSTDTLVGRATTDTLTNKTLTSPIISTIVNTGTLTLPTSTDTLVGRATTDTLTNKTLLSSTTIIADNTDTTKRVQFILSGITTGTTRTFTFPDASTTFVGTNTTQTLSSKILDLPVLITPIIRDTSQNNDYRFVPSELASNIDITLPLLTTNDTFVFAAHAQTLTNKTITATTNNVAAKALICSGTSVDVSGSAAPTVNQVLTATSSTTATWQTASAGAITRQTSTAASTTGITTTTTLNTITTGSTGTYLVLYTSDTSNTTAGTNNTFTILNNGVTDTSLTRVVSWAGSQATNMRTTISTQGVVSLTSGQNITVNVLPSGGTATVSNSTLTIVKLA